MSEATIGSLLVMLGGEGRSDELKGSCMQFCCFAPTLAHLNMLI